MASTVSQSRRFFTYEKSTQNHLKRTANHFFLKNKIENKNLAGLGHRKKFKIFEKKSKFF